MNRLPNEILLLIAEHTVKGTCWRERCRTLHALILCCQRFYKLFQSLLYYDLNLWNFSTSEVRLVIHLWKHPELASRVRKLELCWPSDDENCLEVDDYEDDEQSRVKFIEQALQEIFTPEEKETESKWKDWLHDFREWAWIGVLLVRLTHLENIQFNQGQHSKIIVDVPLKAAKRHKPFHDSPPFPFLRNVCILSNSGVDKKIITPFFYFPNVRSIRGGSIWANTESANILDPCDMIPSSYSVREIAVYGVYHCRGMLDWLAACKKLEHISIEAASHPNDDEIIYPLDSLAFHHAILPFRKTRRTLEVTFSILYNNSLVENNGWGLKEDNIPFPSLQDFSVLENLIIRHAHLMIFPDIMTLQPSNIQLIDKLPTSLKRLSIRDIVDGFYFDLESELLSMVRNRHALPHLVALELGESKILDECSIFEEPCDKLVVECRAAGICLSLVPYEDTWPLAEPLLLFYESLA
ncbi:hypothetical protein BO94DRAFT_576044 [Aspergillus sclerotioniger CBS 115572]|uniref:F-box domain-containing protein n=1 Tax=Aspergillus sclerotioniger CBS 115572 TaxID=1450535 RepID=A0A317WKF0_9EURO|nr:hypothetical protein BO94DRAFT_576044 [Aspergillus sclerotioniger CBS 115572]PWY84670.1 hypothetical protein BO94DRAFT_576044 [Aspergillus sclerotioniger CBS 115572]